MCLHKTPGHPEQPAREINVQAAEHVTNMCSLNAIPSEIQRDTERDGAGPS